MGSSLDFLTGEDTFRPLGARPIEGWPVIAALVGGAIIGAVAGGGGGPKPPNTDAMAEAQRYAADLKYKATQDALALATEIHEQTRADLKPRLDLSHAAMAEINKWLAAGATISKPWEPITAADLEQDPGYRFRVEQGEKAIRRMRNVEGGQSGATMKALLRHGQRLASEEYDRADRRAFRGHLANYARDADRINNLYAMAGLTPNPANAMANLNMQYAQQAGQYIQGGATALGAGEIGAQNAILSGQMAQYRHDLNAQNRLYGFLGTAGGALIGGYYGGWPGVAPGAMIGQQAGAVVPYL